MWTKEHTKVLKAMDRPSASHVQYAGDQTKMDFVMKRNDAPYTRILSAKIARLANQVSESVAQEHLRVLAQECQMVCPESQQLLQVF